MSGDRSRWFPQYYQRVLATDPIAHWMQDEKQGIVSYDMVTARSDGARNGAYTGPTLAQPGIGDGRTSALFDGALDFDNIHTASLNTAFNGAEGTILSWLRVANAGVWTDGAVRFVYQYRVDGDNRTSLSKPAANNTLVWVYEAATVAETHTQAGFVTTDWFSTAIKWSKSAERVDYYAEGVPVAFDINLGIWAGNLDNVRTVIGAATTAPASVWDGWLAHHILWDRAVSDAEILSLGVL